MTDPKPVEESELEQRIEYMLNEQILDWNSPKHLESIDSAKNYAKLIPAIKTLLAQEYERGLKDDQERAINWHKGFDAGYSRGRRDVVFESDPKVMGGTLCVRGTRVPVELVQQILAKGVADEWGWWGWQEPLKEIVLEALEGLEDGKPR